MLGPGNLVLVSLCYVSLGFSQGSASIPLSKIYFKLCAFVSVRVICVGMCLGVQVPVEARVVDYPLELEL